MTTFPISRPFLATPDAWLRVNWRWWLMRLPMFLLALPASYGVGSFAAERLPVVVAVFAGVAFEAAYIGAIAAADQAHDADDRITALLWWLVNAFAVLASVACNLLFFSGSYQAITLESATHAVPLPVLGFFYGLLVHRIASKTAQQQVQAARQSAADRLATRYGCTACPHWRGASIPAFHGHRRGACGGQLVDTWPPA